MKEMFKKSFGFVVGVYAGMVAVNTFGEIMKRLKGEDTSKKEEKSIFEEES